MMNNTPPNYFYYGTTWDTRVGTDSVVAETLARILTCLWLKNIEGN